MSRDAVYLQHILDAADKIERYSAVGQERFFQETYWQDAIIRQLEIIGEATKQISTDLGDQHPEVALSRMDGMRDVLIHNYPGVDLGFVWGVARQGIPELKQSVKAILAEETHK